jgi:hypothetical protein
MKNYHVPLKTGITRTKEFERKLLATHAVNVGLKCGHGCLYCSTPSLVRCHPAFKALHRSAFANGYSVVDGAAAGCLVTTGDAERGADATRGEAHNDRRVSRFGNPAPRRGVNL